MREILFRGKAINRDRGYHRTKYKNGDWVYGLITKLYDERFENLPAEMSNTDGVSGIEIDYKTIGQYTGLTDKNGTKIFEGDIVKIAYCFGWDNEQGKDVPEEEYISKVYSIDGCPFCVDLLHCDGDISPIAWLDWSYDDAEIEAIGNIHDNPELLKEREGK